MPALNKKERSCHAAWWGGRSAVTHKALHLEIYILYLFHSEKITIFLLSGGSLLSGFQPGEMNMSDEVCEQPGS